MAKPPRSFMKRKTLIKDLGPAKEEFLKKPVISWGDALHNTGKGQGFSKGTGRDMEKAALKMDLSPLNNFDVSKRGKSPL
jgi:hypothetical protein